VRTCW